MGVKFSNNGHSTLAASITSSDTSITVASGHGARFPSLGAGDYFYATLIDASNNLEIVKCTARSSDVLTVSRGQESTTARAYAIADRIELRVTATGIADATDVDNILPDQSSANGYFLSSDGTNASWAAGYSLPSQTGNSGKFLTTNGTTESWAVTGGGYKQMVETVYTTVNKVSPGASATDVVAPSTLGDGTFSITIQDAASVLFVNAAIQSGHEDTWNQHFSRVQYKIGAGGSWTHLCGFGCAMYASGLNLFNPSIFIQDILDHNQTVGTTIYFRIISNISYSGAYIWWNRQDPSSSGADNTNEGSYAQSFIRIIEMA